MHSHISKLFHKLSRIGTLGKRLFMAMQWSFDSTLRILLASPTPHSPSTSSTVEGVHTQGLIDVPTSTDSATYTVDDDTRVHENDFEMGPVLNQLGGKGDPPGM